LLSESHGAARERGLPFTVHVAQSVIEVREMIRRHGQTPIQWANALGLLGPGTILAHALYLDTHSWVRWHTRTDLTILGDTGTAVAHCPTPFARYGHVMEDFGAYLRAGVVMGLGTVFNALVNRRDPTSGLSAPVVKALAIGLVPAAMVFLATELPRLQHALLTTSLTGGQWLTCILLAALLPLTVEVGKLVRRRRAGTPAPVTPEVAVTPLRARAGASAP